MDKLLVAQYPDVAIDWAAIDRTLAAGPRGSQPLTATAWEWAQVEHLLREWAATGPAVFPNERATMQAAAAVLQSWRVRTGGGSIPDPASK